jgi:hypothetical protein
MQNFKNECLSLKNNIIRFILAKAQSNRVTSKTNIKVLHKAKKKPTKEYTTSYLYHKGPSISNYSVTEGSRVRRL